MNKEDIKNYLKETPEYEDYSQNIVVNNKCNKGCSCKNKTNSSCGGCKQGNREGCSTCSGCKCK